MRGNGITDCASTEPAAFARPVLGVYGVASTRQRGWPVPALVKMPFTLKSTCVSLKPKVARPGVPVGTSGGGRQA